MPPKNKNKKKSSSKKKTFSKKNITLGVLGLIGLVIWWGMQPLTADIKFGVCRTFAELQLKYPDSINVTAIQQYDNNFEIYFLYDDPYGPSKSKAIDCKISETPEGSIVIEEVHINGRLFEDDEMLQAFNNTIPIVLSQNPIFTYFAPPDDRLVSLKR